MLLITGTPRSGTTLLAAFCKMMGHDPGGEYKQEVNAGLEDLDAWLSLQHLELKRPDSGDRIIDGYSRPVFKLPHFLSRGKPEFLERWARKKPELRLLILLRHPRMVALSLTRNPLLFNELGSVEITELKYRHLTDMFMDAVRYLGLRHEVLQFPDFLTDYQRVQELLTTFGGLAIKPNPEFMAQFRIAYEEGDTPQRIWEKWIDPGKVHHR